MVPLWNQPLWLIIVAFSIFASLVSSSKQCESSRYEHKPRVFVLTDMSNEPDDQMSLVRFLTYANELEIRGIAAITSTWLRNRTDPDTIREVIEGYGEVVSKLNSNVPSDAAYPSAEELLGKVSSGHPVYGLASLDQNNLSDAAVALVQAADESSAADPLWVSIWGGAAVLAEALQHVSSTRDAEAAGKFVETLRVYSISDQDDAGPWIRDRFPTLFYIISLHGWSEYTQPTWIGISGEEYRHFDKGGPNTEIVSNAWLQKHIRIGPLGSHYLNWTFIVEGDTPAFLSLVQNGLEDIDNPQWGGWGGRYTTSIADGGHRFKYATIWRWREDLQHDFAARMQWTVNGNFGGNNHQPIAIVNGSCGPSSLNVEYQFGESLVFDAAESWDPDSDTLSFEWFHYREASGRDLEGFTIPLISQNLDIANLTADGGVVRLEPLKNQTMHLISSIRDNGDMPLVTYRRIILQPSW
ncbi:hypothetical protein BDP81DRAFT_510344 [Colletotrichum phormii]|uniref:Cellulose-binding protein n=1 Tax=Colletotrichum phormii TaxID=359342 RepID=A0AAJ0E9T2_9PEZI|nr:uncharacterized protein BDP81DRAFT_510344 [Colletotrichum phormii]KAK1622023.1 hypothetical protein BDP81DRAFT_510344 [Colletotrichum phormii]